MPAYFDTGFTVRRPSWHGQEMLLDDYPVDWADARVKAGLQWEPRLVRPFTRTCVDPTCPIPDACDHDTLSFEPADNFRLSTRDDTGAVLGMVSPSYHPITHRAMGEIIESLLDVRVGAKVKFETAGSVRGGAAVWALAYLDEPHLLGGQDDTDTYPFLALLNSHDGRVACKAVNTSVRVVCWNTYSAASLEGARTGREFTFRHTARVMERIEEAKLAVRGMRDEASKVNELLADLLGLSLTAHEDGERAVLNHFTDEFIALPPGDVVSDRVRDNVERARAAFRSIYLDSPTTAAHRGTALGLVDAAVEYLDHVRTYKSEDTYVTRTLLRPEPLKARAVKLARKVCA